MGFNFFFFKSRHFAEPIPNPVLPVSAFSDVPWQGLTEMFVSSFFPLVSRLKERNNEACTMFPPLGTECFSGDNEGQKILFNLF